MDPESSIELIQRAQRGDSSALEKLLEKYRSRLQRWAHGRLPRSARDMTDTEDLVQEAMIGAFRNFKDFGQQGEWALQAYLRTAVMNRIRDELRRAGARLTRAELVDLPAADPSPLEAVIGGEVFARYEKALDVLDDAEREAVIARLELGCSYQEIAALVGKPSADAARMMVSRALARLAVSMY
jgi:RNA polymerase sigma-70 factor, ECF subfamily